jgi:ribulose-phosphate 3-epimerase
MEIIPAIIPKSFEDLEEKMSNVCKLAPLVQVDVLDGSLVNLRCWPYLEATRISADLARTSADTNFKEIIAERRGFPFWGDLEFEAHLMVNEPERIISDWIAAGAERIIVQIEGARDFDKCIQEVSGRVPIGVALALDTSHEALKPFAQDIAVIQCMGWKLSHLGRQGEFLDEGIFDKIKALRQDFPKHIISIDGGINLENALKLIEAGADRLVIGSAIWKDGAVRENFKEFKTLQ